MEKPLAASGGLGLAGQAHKSGFSPIRVLVVPRLDFHDARSCRQIRPSPIAAATAARASIFARPRHFLHLTSSMRGAAFPISPSSTKVRFRANCEPRWATESTAATTASPSVHGTSSRAEGREAKLAARDALRAPRLADLARLDDAQFRTLFSKTSIKRTGRDRFVRNVLIAIGNSGDATLADEAERLLDDASPLVRGAAVWALSRLLPREKLCGPCAAASRSRTQPSRRNGPRRLPRIPSPPRSAVRCLPAATADDRHP